MNGDAVRLLVWRDALHFDRFEDLPCALCGKPTPMRSHTDEPVHKVCAEQWNHTHSGALRHVAGTRDLGTRRFHDDVPTASKQTAVRHLSQRPTPESLNLQLPITERKSA
ncbi:hypothetical protein [Streptomyces liliifuscus]|uniref:Uncharacterized protein n=1 Tax=Streptomyces liliifuscus TaxID=2797636 RepID=A0A7T7RHX3_9ACTN|nr:hypothetical protein [Streptomyces liliifuscus]QQM47338.1 hypothetical protein JEQ17_27160 [Streptomyces liliifuscus]